MSDHVSVNEEELGRIFDETLRLIHEGGRMVREAIGRDDKQVEAKLSRNDLVTETDKAVEKLLFEGLKAKFPGHNFIGEESTAAKDGVIEAFTNDPTWIIDPIDGTMNFVHSNPMVSISAALTINKRVEIGIVYLPVLDQMFTARRGKGAEMNGKKIKVSACDDLSNAMIQLELVGSSDIDIINNYSQTVVSLLQKTHTIRTIGSAAIDLAFVAGGHADAYLQSGIHCWDIAAGALLVKEAGGIVLDPSGKEFDFMSRRVLVASTEALARQILEAKLMLVDYDREFTEECPL